MHIVGFFVGQKYNGSAKSNRDGTTFMYPVDISAKSSESDPETRLPLNLGCTT